MERATGQLRNPFSLAKQAQEEKINLLSKVLQNCVACSDLAVPGWENDTQAEKKILMLAKETGAMYQVGKGEQWTRCSDKLTGLLLWLLAPPPVVVRW